MFLRYSTEQAVAEALRRGERIIIRRDRRACRMLSGMAGVLLVMLAAVIGFLPGGGTGAARDSVYGSFLLSPEAGGYVLAAVIAFALGVVITLLCLRRRRMTGKQDDREGGRK